jgi:hypothetical protein
MSRRQERSQVACTCFDKWLTQKSSLLLLIFGIIVLTALTGMYYRSVSTVEYTVAPTYNKTGQGSVTGM